MTKTIATLLVSSKLDYCNSILYNILNREINKVQSVQNCSTRVVTRSPRFCSVTPLLKSLHWLPVQFRIKHKICTLTYKVIHSCQPVYLHNLLKPLNITRNLCSSDDDQLVVPRVSSKMGERAFSVAAPPQLWNCIPLEIKKCKSAQSFRKKLKTLYFGQRRFETTCLGCETSYKNRGETSYKNGGETSHIRVRNNIGPIFLVISSVADINAVKVYSIGQCSLGLHLTVPRIPISQLYESLRPHQ